MFIFQEPRSRLSRNESFATRTRRHSADEAYEKSEVYQQIKNAHAHSLVLSAAPVPSDRNNNDGTGQNSIFVTRGGHFSVGGLPGGGGGGCVLVWHQCGNKHPFDERNKYLDISGPRALIAAFESCEGWEVCRISMNCRRSGWSGDWRNESASLPGIASSRGTFRAKRMPPLGRDWRSPCLSTSNRLVDLWRVILNKDWCMIYHYCTLGYSYIMIYLLTEQVSITLENLFISWAGGV